MSNLAEIKIYINMKNWILGKKNFNATHKHNL